MFHCSWPSVFDSKWFLLRLCSGCAVGVLSSHARCCRHDLLSTPTATETRDNAECVFAVHIFVATGAVWRTAKEMHHASELWRRTWASPAEKSSVCAATETWFPTSRQRAGRQVFSRHEYPVPTEREKHSRYISDDATRAIRVEVGWMRVNLAWRRWQGGSFWPLRFAPRGPKHLHWSSGGLFQRMKCAKTDLSDILQPRNLVFSSGGVQGSGDQGTFVRSPPQKDVSSKEVTNSWLFRQETRRRVTATLPRALFPFRKTSS